MRGDEREAGLMLATVVLADRIPATHPLRDLRRLVDPILRDHSPTFDALYSGTGRPSIPPEQLLRALLLQALYSIRSERQLIEQLEPHQLYRWFVGLDLEASAWHATTFTKNRQRLLGGAIAGHFLARVIGLADASQQIFREHISVDGTLLEAWASEKRVRPLDTDDRDRPVDPDITVVSFHGERRTTSTHRSVTDPEARMTRKSNNTASILSYQASVLTDNRHSLVPGALVRRPHGVAEAEDALVRLQSAPLRRWNVTVNEHLPWRFLRTRRAYRSRRSAAATFPNRRASAAGVSSRTDCAPRSAPAASSASRMRRCPRSGAAAA